MSAETCWMCRDQRFERVEPLSGGAACGSVAEHEDWSRPVTFVKRGRREVMQPHVIRYVCTLPAAHAGDCHRHQIEDVRSTAIAVHAFNTSHPLPAGSIR